ncbi:MAG: hypothetical protein CUN56_17250, partial [Phototrophicales bacterium]
VEKVRSIALWGRSMGAVVALMAHAQNSDIAALVLDSPFSNLKDLCGELAAKYSKLPGFLVNILWYFLKRKIHQKIAVDLDNLNTMDYVDKCVGSALFVTA